MKNNETGEFELVVGNRQLLSGFFIVILLLAVTFAMGYVVGQNSPRSPRTQAEATSSPVTPAEVRPQPASALTPPPVTPPATPAGDQIQTPEDAVAQPTTQPARDSAAGVPVAPLAEAPAPASAPSVAQATVSEAPPGSYWQVMALPLPGAQAVVQTLRDKGFPALLSTGPNKLVRVLVGPYNDVQAMSKAKNELEDVGLHPVRR